MARHVKFNLCTPPLIKKQEAEADHDIHLYNKCMPKLELCEIRGLSLGGKPISFNAMLTYTGTAILGLFVYLDPWNLLVCSRCFQEL